MPEPLSLTFSGSIGPTSDGDVFQLVVADESVSKERATPSVPAAKSGTLSTRTDDDTGVVAAATGHGFTTGNKIDVFWSGGSRRAMDATVAGDNVTLDGGSGDVLPAADTAVGLMVPVEVPFEVDGSAVLAIGVRADTPAWIVFVEDDAGEADVAAASYQIATAGTGHFWLTGAGVGANPLDTLTIVKVKFSHGDVNNAQTLRCVVGLNAP